MGTKYTSQATSGYNTSPPSDDGSTAQSNKVLWSTIKTKLSDVLKTFAEAINSQLVTTLNTSARAISASDSAAATDHWRTIQVNTASVTVTLADVATMAAGYMVTVSNQSSGFTKIALTTSTNTIDSVTNAVQALGPKEARTYLVNAAVTGYVSLPDRRRDLVSVRDHGAIGDGVADDTAAFQAALDLMAAGTDTDTNPSIFVPPGDFLVSSTLTPVNSASNFCIVGSGKQASVIRWNGAAGSPVFKFTNPRNVWMRDLSIYGDSGAKPSALVQYHNAAGGTVGASTGFCGLQRVRLGDGTGDFTKGVLTSADVGHDENNEEHVFEDVDIIGAATYGYHFSHSNSLLHRIIRGSVQSYGTAAISNDCAGASNASFTVRDTTFSGANNSVIFEVSSPLTAVEIYGAFHENGATTNTKLLSTPTAFVSAVIRFFGGFFNMADATTTSSVVWNGDSASSLEFHGVTQFAGSTYTYDFQGAGRVSFFGGTSSTTSMTYNGETTLYNVREAAGAPTYTQAGAGTLRLVRSSGTAQIEAPNIITSGATPSVSGLNVDGLLILQYVGATNLTSLLNGYAGQTVTLFANNGNATIVHASADDKPFLQGAANFAMATGNTLTLRKLGTATGVNAWVEIGRKT